MKLLGNKILLRQHRTKDTTEGGIQLPQAAIQKLPYGTVVQVSESVQDVQAGDTIMFNEIGAVTIKTPKGDEEFLLIEPDDILGILEEGEF